LIWGPPYDATIDINNVLPQLLDDPINGFFQIFPSNSIENLVLSNKVQKFKINN
jgi:hypothetical protein